MSGGPSEGTRPELAWRAVRMSAGAVRHIRVGSVSEVAHLRCWLRPETVRKWVRQARGRCRRTAPGPRPKNPLS